MGRPAVISQELKQGDAFTHQAQFEEDGVNHDWSSATVSIVLKDTSDDSTVQTLSPTTQTTSGDNDEILNVTFSVSGGSGSGNTGSWPVSTLKGDLQISGTALGVVTPQQLLIYVIKDYN